LFLLDYFLKVSVLSVSGSARGHGEKSENDSVGRRQRGSLSARVPKTARPGWSSTAKSRFFYEPAFKTIKRKPYININEQGLEIIKSPPDASAIATDEGIIREVIARSLALEEGERHRPPFDTGAFETARYLFRHVCHEADQPHYYHTKCFANFS
jgi:hypothetical protein